MKYTGGITELRLARQRQRAVRDGARALRQLGEGFERAADEAEDAAERLAASLFWVPVACLLCGVPQQVPVLIGDPQIAEPNTVICGPCDDMVGESLPGRG